MGFVDKLFGDKINKVVEERVALERVELQKYIAETEAKMVEVSEHKAQEKAQELLSNFQEELSKAEKDKEKNTEPKSYMNDPFQLMESLGYKERIMSMSYDTLRLMSERNPVVAAIINTRIHQVTAFSRPPKTKYDVGFEIVMRDTEAKPSKQDLAKMKELSDMMESTGIPGVIEEEERDSFNHFLSKVTRDSLTYDQNSFEIVPGRGGKPVAFYAVDASTIRFATTPQVLQRVAGYRTEHLESMWKREMESQQQSTKEERRPKPEDVRYVQIISSRVMNTYSDKEMAFGIRNPRTYIQHNNYGVAELEILISVITSHLWAEEYNRRFFSSGSAPKGFIHFESPTGSSVGIPQEQLMAFRRQWHAQVAGVQNAWRTPIISSPAKMQYTNLQMSNRQMEFSNWIEYLIKLVSAVFLMDPSEINFDLKGGAAQQAPMFDSPSGVKIKASRDRGLKPLLRFLESEINKNIIFQIDPRFEFQFVGLDPQSEKEIQELRIKELERFKTIDEVRAEYDLKGLGPDLGGDLIMESSYINYRIQKAQMAQMGGGGLPGGAPGGPGEEGPDFGTESPGSTEELDQTMEEMDKERGVPSMVGGEEKPPKGGELDEFDKIMEEMAKRRKK